MIKGLVLLVSLGLGACSPELELLQNEVDVETEAETACGWWTTHSLFPAAAQQLTQCNLHFVTNECESYIEAKVQPAKCVTNKKTGKPECTYPVAVGGKIKFRQRDWKGSPDGGEVWAKRNVDLTPGAVAAIGVSITGEVKISIGMTTRGARWMCVNLEAALSGTLLVTAGIASAHARITGKITLPNFNIVAGTADAPRPSISMHVGITIGNKMYEFEVKMDSDGQYSMPDNPVGKVLAHLENAAHQQYADLKTIGGQYGQRRRGTGGGGGGTSGAVNNVHRTTGAYQRTSSNVNRARSFCCR